MPWHSQDLNGPSEGRKCHAECHHLSLTAFRGAKCQMQNCRCKVKWYSRFDDRPVSSRSCLKLTALSPRFFTTWCQFFASKWQHSDTSFNNLIFFTGKSWLCRFFRIFLRWLSIWFSTTLPVTTFSPTYTFDQHHTCQRWDSVKHQSGGNSKDSPIWNKETSSHFGKHVEIGLESRWGSWEFAFHPSRPWALCSVSSSQIASSPGEKFHRNLCFFLSWSSSNHLNSGKGMEDLLLFSESP